MILQKLRLRNFTVHKDREFTFDKSVVAVCGSNGSGKTSLFNAITIALFKQQERGNLDDLITFGQKTCEIELEFAINSDSYKIMYSKERGKTPTHQLYKNNELVTETTTATVTYIQNLLNIDYNGFIGSVFSPQDRLNFLTSSKPDARKEILSSFLGISNLLKVGTKAQDVRRELNLRKASTQGKYDITFAQLQKVRDLLSKQPVDGKVQELTNDLEAVTEQIEKLKNNATVSQQLKQLQSRLDESQKRINSWLEQIQVLEDTNAEELEKGIQSIESDKYKIQNEKSTLVRAQQEVYTYIGSLESQILGIDKAIKQIMQLAQCPTCFRTITEDDKKWLTIKLSNDQPKIETDLAKYKDGLNKIQNQIISLDTKFGTLEHELNQMRGLLSKQNAYSQYKKMIDQVYEERAKYKEEFDQLQTKIQDFDPITYNMLLQNKTHLQYNLDAVRTAIAERKANQDAEARLGEEIKQHYDTLSYFTNEVKDYKTIEDMYSEQGIITFAIMKFISQIETLTNEILKLLCPTLSVQFHVGQKALDIKVSTPGATLAYELRSGGEKSKVDLAIRLALAILVQNTKGYKLSTIFLDEVLSAIDVEGRENFLKVLTFVGNYFSRIIMVSHQVDVNNSFVERIEL